MTDDVRRWSVTYTKQLHQKRKVYQDGLLELQSSSHKVKLYDDCDKLLDSRIVKLDDAAVRSGETLTFGAFLVDIGDPYGETHSILSFLKKPSAQDGVMEKVNVREIHPSQDSAFVQSGIQYQVEGNSNSRSKRSEEAVPNEKTEAANVGGRPEAMSSKATSTSSFNELANETKDQSNTEISGDNRTIDSSVHDVSSNTRKGFKKTNSRNDEFPSFDLKID